MDLYLVKLGKRDKLISVFDESDDLTNYLKNIHSCTYLEDETVDKLSTIEPGSYLLYDEATDIFTIYKVKDKTSEGYIYNSIYRKIKKIIEYKVITD